MIRNSYANGFFLGLIYVAVTFFSWKKFELLLPTDGTLKARLQPPALQLILLAIIIVLFRFMMLKWNLPKTGIAMFIVVFVATFLAFLNNRFRFM